MASGAPVKAPDLDDIQDNIVGDKHAEQAHPITMAGWKNQGNVIDNPGGAGDTILSDNSGAVSAALAFLPVGDRITHVVFSFSRAAAGTITCKLRKRDLTTAAAAVDVATAAVNAGAGVLNHDIAAINETLAAGFAYWLEVFADAAATAAGVVVFGAIVFADRL